MRRPNNFSRSAKPNQIELPESAQVIAEVIGRTATLELAKRAKGRKIYVPKTLCAGHEVRRCGRTSREAKPRCTCRGHWIAETVGDALAVKLSRTFGGESLDLAGCYYVHAFARNERIREQHKAGVPIVRLMEEHGMSQRAIRYIVQGWNGRQDRPRNTGRSEAGTDAGASIGAATREEGR